MAAIRLTPAQARHAWLARQRLTADPARRPRTLAEFVGDVGWIAMTSAVTPHLALFARGALAARAELDEAYKRGDLSVVPGPRGSTFLVPTADAPLARAFAVADHASREARVAAATTLTSKDLQGARDALRAAIATPASAEEVRARIPDAFLRSLGTIGRKNGLPTVAALVLRSMWVNGEVVRLASDGRLDRGGVLWGIDPRPRTVPTAADAVDAIAARRLAAHAPMSLKAFSLAFGIAAGRASAALRPLQPIEAEIEGLEGTFLVPADFVPATEAAAVPPRLLPLRDPLTDAQLAGLATPAAGRAAQSRAAGVGPVVLAGDSVVAAWQYDEVARVITWRALEAPPGPDLAAAIDAEARRVAAFIATELHGAPLHTAPAARPRPGGAPKPDELSIEMP